MHEQSLACALLSKVDDLSASHRNGEVRRVRLTVGEFSGVDAELLGSALRQASACTALQGVEFSIARVPLEARCRTCSTDFPVERFCFDCPECGGSTTDIIRGEELVLESVTFEELAP